MSAAGELLKLNRFRQLHVLGVDAQDFETAILIRDADVKFAIEATETTKSAIDRVGTVGRADDDNLKN